MNKFNTADAMQGHVRNAFASAGLVHQMRLDCDTSGLNSKEWTGATGIQTATNN